MPDGTFGNEEQSNAQNHVTEQTHKDFFALIEKNGSILVYVIWACEVFVEMKANCVGLGEMVGWGGETEKKKKKKQSNSRDRAFWIGRWQ